MLNYFSFAFDTAWIFLVAFGTTLGLLFSLCHWTPFKSILRRSEKGRESAAPRYFRLGGLALAGGFLATLFFDQRLVFDVSLQILLTGGGLAFLFGLVDDFWPLPWFFQLSSQVFLGAILFFAGMTIESIHLGGGRVIEFTTLPGAVLGITVAWTVLVMNAVNWVDGVDGLMAGVLSIAFVTLFTLSLRPEVNQPTLALLATMLLGSLIAFLFLNWFPAKILAGTGGAAFLGFMLAALSVYAGTKVATALLVLVVPILDTFSVIVGRLLQRRSPFLPDKHHLHHHLLELGWLPSQVASAYMLVTSLMAFLALSTRLLEKLGVFVAVAFLFFGTAVWVERCLNSKQGSCE